MNFEKSPVTKKNTLVFARKKLLLKINALLVLLLNFLLFQTTSGAQNNSIFYGGSGGGSGIVCLTQPIILPIELVFFEASCYENKVNLNWQTASENNNNKFIIERSFDGYQYDKIAEINSSGSSSITSNYNYSDSSFKLGVNYYRLSQSDLNGTITFLDIAAVQFCGSEEFHIYPNPFTDYFTIDLNSYADQAKLIVKDMLGKIVYTEVFEETSQIEYQLDNLFSGQYVIDVLVNENKLLRTIVIKI